VQAAVRHEAVGSATCSAPGHAGNNSTASKQTKLTQWLWFSSKPLLYSDTPRPPAHSACEALIPLPQIVVNGFRQPAVIRLGGQRRVLMGRLACGHDLDGEHRGCGAEEAQEAIYLNAPRGNEVMRACPVWSLATFRSVGPVVRVAESDRRLR
jgi:hypothetical protein